MLLKFIVVFQYSTSRFGTTSQAVGRRLHHWCVSIKLLSDGAYCFAVRYLVNLATVMLCF